MGRFRTLLRHPLFPLLIPLGLSLLPYLTVLGNGLVWDDEQFILGWPHPSTSAHVRDLLAGGLPDGHAGVYRPVRSLLFWLTFRLFTTAPVGYHMFSLLVHLAGIAAVYGIARLLTKRTVPAVIAGLWFGLHPIHTEAVTFATASFDTAGVVGGLIGVWCFGQWHRKRDPFYYGLSLLSITLATFTNEIALALPLLLVLTDVRWRSGRTGPDRRLLLPFFLPAAAYLLLRFGLLHIPVRSDIFPDTVVMLLTMTKVFTWYVLRLIAPLRLTVVPVLFPGVTSLTSDPTALAAQRFTDPATLTGILLCAGIVAGSLWFRRRAPVASLGLVWFLLSLLPVSNLIPAGTIFAERYLYLPAAGIALAVGAVWEAGLRYARTRRPAAVVLIVCLLAFTGRTQLRNLDWRSPVSLWEKTVAQVPDHPLIWNNLGLAYAQQGQYPAAITAFERTLALDPEEAKAYYNLGLVQQTQRNYTQAVPFLRQAVTLRADILPYRFALAENLTLSGKFTEAFMMLRETPPTRETEIQLYGLGMLVLRANNLALAADILEQVILINPTHPEALNNLGAMYLALEQYDRAAEILERAVRQSPEDYTVHFNLGVAYRTLGRTEAAITVFETAQRINPFAKDVEKNLQQLYKESTASGKPRTDKP